MRDERHERRKRWTRDEKAKWITSKLRAKKYWGRDTRGERQEGRARREKRDER
jgi:hypothetical protein